MSLITTKQARDIEMLLAQYLTERGVKELALTRAEAKILGLSWPLEKGWAFRFGQIRIDDSQLRLLRSALGVKRAKEQKDFFHASDGMATVRHVARDQIVFGTTTGSDYHPTTCKCLPWEDCTCDATK
jgi:hypothetical protein